MTIARIGAATAFFAVVGAVMVWVLVGAGQAWVSLYDAMVSAGGHYRQAGQFLGWLAFVLRLDYLLSVVVFVHAFGLLLKLWWVMKGIV